MPSYVSYGWGYGYYPVLFGPSIYATTSPGYATETYAPQPIVVLSLGTTAQAVEEGGGGGALGLSASMEGQSWGLAVQTNSYVMPSYVQIGGGDVFHLLYAHVTYAILSGPSGRLRLEGGVDSAFTSTTSIVAPGAGMSAAVGLLGALGAEAALHVTPWPFTQLDWNAGLTLALGPVGVRAGWRRTYLNGDGNFRGAMSQDAAYTGPYVGLGLAL